MVRALEGARARGADTVSIRTGIDQIKTMAINQDTAGKSIKITKDNVQEVVEDLEGGEAFEELEYEAVEKIDYEDESYEDVIYVGGKKHSIYTPRKER